MPTHGLRSLALVLVLASSARSQPLIDVSGAWNFCVGPNANNGVVQRPTSNLTQAGGHVSGTVKYPFFQGFLTCTVGFDIDSATGAFVPGTDTEQCPLGVTVGLRPAIATAGRIDGEFGGQITGRGPFYGLRACDPMAPDCDDGDPATVDTCSTTVDCFGVALAPSCIHTGCTTDLCVTTGCAHPVVVQPGAPPGECEDGDACTVRNMCTLALCGDGPLTETVTSMTSPRVTLGRLGAPTGNDTLVVKGQVILPAPLTIRPEEVGIHVLVVDANGTTVVDEDIPGGPFNPFTGTGWTVTPRAASYADRRKVDPGPIRKVSIKPNLGTPGLVKFHIQGKAGSYLPSPTLPLSAFVDLSPDFFPLDGGTCADFPVPGDCTAGSGGTKIRCR